MTPIDTKYASISTALTKIDSDAHKGKNVKNYTIVMYNDKAIVCRDCIHDLVLRIFGGRRNKVEQALPGYLASDIYKENRMQQVNEMLDGRSYSQEAAQQQITTMISDYHVISKYKNIPEEKKLELEIKICNLIAENNKERKGKIPEDVQKEILAFMNEIKSDTITDLRTDPITQKHIDGYITEVFNKDKNLEIDEELSSINEDTLFDEKFEEKLSTLLKVSTWHTDHEFEKKLHALIDKYENQVGSGEIPNELKTAINIFKKQS